MAVTRPTTVRCIFSNIQFRHQAHDSKLGDVVFHCKGWPIVEPKPKVKVYWGEPLMKSSIAYRPGFKMWIGKCEGCDHVTQYWSWGAALGHMLEHQWIGCEGEKNRARDRRRKYNRVEPEEARLSCGGRTHGIMGEDQRQVVRRSDVPADVPSGTGSDETSTGQAAFARHGIRQEQFPTFGESMGHPGGVYG